MQNKYLSRRYPSLKLLLPLGLLLLGGSQFTLASDLSTLFTTPQERELINSNRYNSDEVKQPVVVGKVIEAPLQQLLKEQVSREYIISGITVSSEGSHTVWINSQAYEDGEALEDNSRIKVVVGDEVAVRITAPDGKHYFATSGETLEVTYLAPVKN
jgi:hypothetical protein